MTTALMQRSGRAAVTTDLWPHGLTAEGRAMHVCALPAPATLAALVAREWPTALMQRSGRAGGARIGNGAEIVAAAVDG